LFETVRGVMGNARKHGEGTRCRLLEAACHIFAERGYHDATVAEICARAEANIAAVNYHFGGKEALYREAWRHSFQRAISAYPPGGGVPETAPAEERLGGWVRSLLQRAFGPEDTAFELMARESANPTGLLDEILREVIRPQRREMAAIVRELLGEDAPRQVVRFCCLSVVSQCVNLGQRHRMHRKLRRKGWTSRASLDELVDHITRFSLAGIRAAACR
jgi:AcrR family transcriptional regulator